MFDIKITTAILQDIIDRYHTYGKHATMFSLFSSFIGTTEFKNGMNRMHAPKARFE